MNVVNKYAVAKRKRYASRKQNSASSVVCVVVILTYCASLLALKSSFTHCEMHNIHVGI